MVYIDNSATSRKKPLSVALTAAKEILFSANAGRAGHKAGMKTAKKIEKTREILRKIFFDGNVVFTKNCTEALNLGINGIKPSGQVITTVYDHNSVLRTLKKLELDGKIKLKIISPDENGSFETALKNALKVKTSLVAVTGRSNVNGKKTNFSRLAEITKRYSDAIFLLDAAQTAGHDESDYENVDLIASSGHKGLLGPQGTGFLVIRKNIKLFPLIVGGTGTSSNKLEIPFEIPEGMEAGTLNAAGIIALGKGAAYASKRADIINKKTDRLAKIFLDGIKNERNVEIYPCDGGIVLCNVKGKDSSYLADELSEKYSICVRGGLHCAPLMHKFLGTDGRGAVRFSFGNNNNVFHVLKAIYAVRKIAREKR